MFISLGKLRTKPTKEMSERATKMVEGFQQRGIKVIGFYWTLGRYDTVIIFEAPTERDAMKTAIDAGEFVSTETLVAVPREEAIKML